MLLPISWISTPATPSPVPLSSPSVALPRVRFYPTNLQSSHHKGTLTAHMSYLAPRRSSILDRDRPVGSILCKTRAQERQHTHSNILTMRGEAWRHVTASGSEIHVFVEAWTNVDVCLCMSLYSANFSLSSDCPDGWMVASPDADMTCTLIPATPATFHYSTGVQQLVWILSAITVAVVLVTLAFIMYVRDTVILKAASVPFCVVTLCFTVTLAVGSVFYAISPEHGAWVCHARVWIASKCCAEA